MERERLSAVLAIPSPRHSGARDRADEALATSADPESQSLDACLRASGVGAYTWHKKRDLVIWQGYPHPALGRSGIRKNPLSVFLAALHPDDIDSVLKTVERATLGRHKWEMRYRVIWPDGSLHWVLDRGEPSIGSDGEIEGFSGVCFEVSSHVETEQALARQRTFLRMVLDLNPGLIFAKDREGRFTLANQALADFYGTNVEELIGETDADFNANAADVARFREQDLLVIDRREAMHGFEEELADARGRRRWYQITKLPLIEEDGSCDQVVGIAVDTTEHKQSELEIAKQRAFLHQVIDSSPSLIFAKNRAGRYTLANQAVAELYGTTAGHMIGKVDAELHGITEEANGYVANDAVVFERGEPVFVGEEQFTTPGGAARWFHTVKVPLRNEAGEVDQSLGVATEITEQKREQEARERLEESLRQSQKMESIGHLAAGIAHDFNNLLTPILGYAELSREALPEDDPVREDLAAVTAAAESASALVQQLLAFGRKQLLDIRELDLNRELTYITKILKRVIPEHVRIELELDPKVEGVRADPTQLQQILLNLAVNARDAMPTGGELCIRTQLGADPQGGAGDGALITVSDTGCGMSEDVLTRAFEPFFTTKERASRVGLGLSTVYGIAEQHGGSVGVESEAGRGTRFSIWLPVCAARATSAPTPTTRESPGKRRGSVLVVEDDPGVRSFVCRTLAERGFEVRAAECGDEALDIARNPEVAIDLLLTDIVMPGTSGPTLYNEVATHRPDTRVLFMSGYAEDALDPRASHGVADRLLNKPFSVDTLIAGVSAALR